MKFDAIPANDAIVKQLTALQAENPFATLEYFKAKEILGFSCWILRLWDVNDQLLAGCGAFLKTGRLRRELEIPSLPAVNAESPFWKGVRDFCRQHRVTGIDLGTFGSKPGVEIPTLGATCVPRSRAEYLLPTNGGDVSVGLSSNHRRNIKKALKAGITMQRSRSESEALVHHELMRGSLDRRRRRGEQVPVSGADAAAFAETVALLKSNAGELFQAHHGGEARSSVLVLRSQKGGYYHSAGTSPEGMENGASHFLIASIAECLREGGVETFNLGGAEDGTSLARFKSGFGASRVQLSAMRCEYPTFLLNLARTGGRLVRFGRSAAQAARRFRISKVLVYSAETQHACHPDEVVGIEFRHIPAEEILAMPEDPDGFAQRQKQRLQRFGESYAYGVVVDGALAHVSWLLPPSAMAKDPPCVIQPGDDTMEITACETLPQFRGRGLYVLAIQMLMLVAKSLKVSTVYMKTTSDNVSSQRGIEKAGLQKLGAVILARLPAKSNPIIWRRYRSSPGRD